MQLLLAVPYWKSATHAFLKREATGSDVLSML